MRERERERESEFHQVLFCLNLTRDSTAHSCSFCPQILHTDSTHTFDNPISGQQEAEIFNPVVVIPETLVFPWYPVTTQVTANTHQYHYLLKVIQIHLLQ